MSEWYSSWKQDEIFFCNIVTCVYMYIVPYLYMHIIRVNSSIMYMYIFEYTCWLCLHLFLFAF